MGWAQHTSATFTVREFPGGHFFLRDSLGALDVVCQLARG
jgi:surfactin synthase thioesterase subunit